jgi:exodeoxyribonuclease VII large subunit
MPRATITQWEFGELFPKETGRAVLTVSEITTRVRKLLESNFGVVWVSGEIANLRLQSSGHAYFTLKDSSAQIQCVLFRSDGAAFRHLLADGKKVLVHAELTVYEPRGQYQLRVVGVESQGQGALQEAFERLKLKLQSEGLFAPERKRPIPKYSERLGLATSLSGAAIRDVLHVVERRHPGLEILVAPCLVQGKSAAPDIVEALRRLNEWSVAQPSGQGLDLILLTRGGGSLEDLWAFNEETVARAIAASALPVVSAVGHEIDFTIADFVADLRAATPSAAAEIITEGVYSSAKFVLKTASWLQQKASDTVARHRNGLESLVARLRRGHPRRVVRDQSLLLDEAQLRLARAVRSALRAKALSGQSARDRLARIRPSVALERLLQRLDEARARLPKEARRALDRRQTRFAAAAAKLNLLSPAQALARGYSITLDDESGAVIRRTGQVRPGQALRTKVADGDIRSRAT